MSDRRSIVDFVLASPWRVAGSRLPRHHDRTNDDYRFVHVQRFPAKDLLPLHRDLVTLKYLFDFHLRSRI